MTPSPPEPPIAGGDLDPLTEAALAWLVRLHSGTATDKDWGDYDAWRETDDAHRRACEAAEHLWETLGTPLVRRKPPTILKVFALLLLLGGATGLGFSAGLFELPKRLLADVRTAPAERRSVVLADGSRIELDGGTSLDVKFDDKLRRIVLYAGDIYINVTPDPARPFRVEAGAGRARALGTAFDVRRDGDEVEVTVSEHTVRVSYPDEDAGQSVDVSEGNEVAYSAMKGLGPVRPADISAATAWRRGRLVFDGRRLADVIAQMGRYHPGKILILDKELADLPVTGTFQITDSDALLDAITAALPLRLRKLPWLTIVERDPDRAIEPFQKHKED